MPDVGDVLDGYHLDAVIGRGGMGTVYRATDRALEKTVALKVIAPHLADDETFVQRFREEAKALARLDADGIVDVYAMRETDKALFFVMEYIEGPSLQTVLGQQGALDPSAALSLLRQVLTAVGHAHASGVLHRDLKPSNILLDDHGHAVITDFGLAKILASDAELTATHEQLGTVAYMSPEQVEGLQNVNEASDLFSVGLIAYEAFTGRLPFDRSGSDFHIQQSIVEGTFPPPSAHEPSIPPPVEQVVMDLLSTDPASRPSDAQAALARLPVPEDETSVLRPEASAPSDALTAGQWAGGAAVVLLVLVGVYVGVRATLGLPILSVSSPSPPDTTSQIAAAGQMVTERDTGRNKASKTSRHPSEAASGTDQSENEQQPPSPTTDTGSLRTPSTPSTPESDTEASTQGAQPSESSAQPSPHTSTADKELSNTQQPSSRGVLSIRSQPGNAEVRLDGSPVGHTPLTLGDLEPGPHRVGLRLNDHRPLKTTITVRDEDTTVVTRELVPRPAVVRLQVVPSGDVQINGTRRSTSSDGAVVDSLSPGTHRITITSPLGQWETQLQLEAGERYQRTVDFTERVDLAVTARSPDGTPLPNATVRVDGETVGYTPQRLTLRVGQHTIQIEKEGYQSVTRRVLIETDMETPLVFELSLVSE